MANLRIVVLQSQFLNGRGLTASKTWDAVDAVCSGLMSNKCGHYINVHGARLKEGQLIDEHSKRIGMAKAYPNVLEVVQSKCDAFVNTFFVVDTFTICY